MVCRLNSGFSGTPGIGNTIQKRFVFDFDVKKCPYIPNTAITNTSDVTKIKHATTRTKLLKRLGDMQEKLDRIFSHHVDPIEYLMYLYYKEELSLPDIYKRLQEIGIEYASYKSLWHLFTRSFGWETRGYEETDMWRKKNMKSNKIRKENAEKMNQENIQMLISRFRSCLMSIPQTRLPEKTFQENIYESLSLLDKAFYLIEIYGNTPLSKQSFFQTLEIPSIGARIGARILNTELADISKTHNTISVFEISSGLISYYLKQSKQSPHSPTTHPHHTAQ